MKRKEFLKASSFAVTGLSIGLPLFAKNGILNGSDDYLLGLDGNQNVCTVVPSETAGPFPSTPAGDAMYWRNNITDGMAGVPYTITIKLFGTNNSGILQGYRVDVWHCNAHGYYSHYAASGMNTGHSGQNNSGSKNSSLIYGRGIGITDANGEVTFTSIFPGWYPGRTMHIHFAIYSSGTVGSNNGWVQKAVSQFTTPIAAKNAVYTSQAPYNIYGADPQDPNNDNVFSSPSGAWSTLQMATLTGSGAGPYSSYYECAVEATGVLPLNLIGFDGSAYGQSCLLRWKTENEINFSHFKLEYSADADDFEYLARFETTNSSTGRGDYAYTDKDRLLFGNAFYRLKMVDKDGKFTYSSTVPIHNNNRVAIKIGTNPVTNNLILFHPYSNGKEQVLVTDMSGRAIGITKLQANSRYSKINVSLCPRGTYFLIYSDGKYSQTLKFMVAK